MRIKRVLEFSFRDPSSFFICGLHFSSAAPAALVTIYCFNF